MATNEFLAVRDRMFDELKSYGLKLAPIEEELGFYNGQLHGRNIARIGPDILGELADFVARKAELLTNFSFTSSQNFEKVLLKAHIREAWVASQLGITKQGLSVCKQRGFSEERKREVERILRNLGKSLQKVCRTHSGEFRKAA